MAQQTENNQGSAKTGNVIGTLWWISVIFATTMTTSQLVKEDTVHNPAGVLPAFGTAMLLVIVVALVLLGRRLTALLTGMTVKQRRKLDPWRSDYCATVGFGLVALVAVIASSIPAVDYALGGDITLTILISVMCIYPVTDLLSRRWLVWQTVKENQGGWISRTRVGASMTTRFSRISQWWKDLPN